MNCISRLFTTRATFGLTLTSVLLACIALPAQAQDPTDLGRIDLRLSRTNLTENAGAVQLEVTAAVAGTAPSADVTVNITVANLGTAPADYVQYTGFASFSITIPDGMRSGVSNQTITVTNDDLVNGTNVLTLTGQVSTSGFTGSVTPVALSLFNDDAIPILQSVSVDGPVLTLIYDKTMDADVNVNHFRVTIAADFVLVSSAALNSDDNKKVELMMTKSAKAGEAVTIAYDKSTTINGSTANTLADAAGNEAASFGSRSAPNKTAIPSVTITGPDGPVAADAFEIAIAFSEAVTGFVLSDIKVSNGTAGDFSDEGDGEFTAEIDPDKAGTVSVSVGAGAAMSTRSGTENSAAPSFSVMSDQTAPTVALSAPSGTVTGSFTLTLASTEAITGSNGDDLEVSVMDITGGGASDFKAVGTARNRYQSIITPTAGVTEVVITVDAGDVFDLAGNASTAGAELRRNVSFRALSVSITTNAGSTTETRPFKGSAFEARFVFSGLVGTGNCSFDASAVDVTGGSVTAVSGSGRSYSATIRSVNSGNIGDPNQVTVNLASSGTCDPANNPYPPLNSPVSVWVATGPTVSTLSAQSATNGESTRDVDVTFSADVTPLSTSGLAVSNGRATRVVANPAGSRTNFVATIQPAEDGMVSVSVKPGAVRSRTGSVANLPSETPATFAGYVSSPVTITGPSSTVNGAFAVTITFADPGGVSGFELGEVVVSSNATVAALSGSGSVYTATINPNADGVVTVSVAANVAEDTGGLSNLASNTFSVRVDRTAPVAGRVRLDVTPTTIAEDAGATTVTVMATVQGELFQTNQTVTVSAAASGKTGVVGFSPVSPLIITIPAGERAASGMFTLTPINNTAAEEAETVTLNGVLSGGGVVVAATVRLLDDDGGGNGGGGGETVPDAIRLSVRPTTIAEDAGATSVAVTAAVFDGDEESSFLEDVVVTVSVMAAQDAGVVSFTPVEDFDITIRAGRNRAISAVTITPIDDSTTEGNATLAFAGASDADVTITTATLTLEDDDDGPIELSLALDPQTVEEDGGTTTVAATVGFVGARRFATDQNVTVTVVGSDEAGVVQFGDVSDFTITIGANQASGTGSFTITPVNNTFVDKDETVTVTATFGQTTQVATLILANDDSNPENIVLAARPPVISEGAGTTTVTVSATIDGVSTFATDQMVPITVTGSGNAGAVEFAEVADFSITIPAARSSGTATFTLAPVNNNVDEMDETITVGSTHSLVKSTVTITLADDDQAPTGVSLSADPRTVQEGPTVVITVTATVQGTGRFGTDQEILVTVAGSGKDRVVGFAPVAPFTVTIPAEKASGSATFSLSPTDNTIDELDETITVSSADTQVTGTSLTLEDDDAAPTGISIALDVDNVSESQGATSVKVTASVDGGTLFSTDQSIDLTAKGTLATGVVGFTPIPEFTLTIVAGAANGTATFTITPENNNVDEADETITVASNSSLVANTRTVLIRDDDATPTGITITTNPSSVSEGAGETSVSVTAQVQGGTTFASAQSVTVSAAYSSDADVVGVSAPMSLEIMIPAEAATGSAPYAVVPADNNVDERDAVITLTVTSKHGSDDTPSVATVTVMDDDNAPTGMAIAVDPTTIAEGAGATTVSVTATVEGGTVFAASQTAQVSVASSATGVSFENVETFDLIVAAGAATGMATFALTPQDNRVRDADGTAIVRLSHSGQSSEATIVLTDNDHDVARVADLNATLLPEMARAIVASTVGAVANRIGKAYTPGGGMSLSVGGYSSVGSVVQRLRARQFSGAGIGWHDRLDATSFAVSPAATGVFDRLTLWAEGDYRKFSGEDANTDWDASLSGVHFGADALLGSGVLVGLAISSAIGGADYVYRGNHIGEGSSLAGTYDASMFTLTPYASWSWAAGSSIWASAGFGSGDIEIADGEISVSESEDSNLLTTALGATIRVMNAKNGDRTTSIDLKGEAWQSEIDVDANGSAFSASKANINRVRIAVEGGYARRLVSGSVVTPFLEVGLRSDGGDGLTGFGVELGGGLRFTAPVGLRVEGRGRTLLAHAGELQEWGFGGNLSYARGGQGRGMSIELGTSAGSVASGMHRIWSDRDMTPGTSAFDAAPRLHSQIGYGMDVAGGMLRPYGGVDISGPIGVSSRVGTHYRVGRRLNLGVEVAHNALPRQLGSTPVVRGVVSLY